MKKRDDSMDALAREETEGKIERYRRGAHTCKECGSASFWLVGCEEYKDKVRSLLFKEVTSFKEGELVDGYCPDCLWDKRGVGLDVEVVVRIAKEGKEPPDQIVERLKSHLQALGLSFKIKGFGRRHLREEW